MNPEETQQEMPLSFRERLMKSSTILGGIIDNMRSKEEELRSKEEKVRHQNRNLSTKLSYQASAAQLEQQKKQRQALTEEEQFQRKLQIAINKRKREFKIERKMQRRQEREEEKERQ